jgi:hypothetical protein
MSLKSRSQLAIRADFRFDRFVSSEAARTPRPDTVGLGHKAGHVRRARATSEVVQPITSGFSPTTTLTSRSPPGGGGGFRFREVGACSSDQREQASAGWSEVGERSASLSLGGAKERAVLAILLPPRGEVVSSERLIDELWGERPPASATSACLDAASHGMITLRHRNKDVTSPHSGVQSVPRWPPRRTGAAAPPQDTRVSRRC